MINALKELGKIGDFDVYVKGEGDIPPDAKIIVDPSEGSVTLKLQTGTIDDVGVIGLQIDDLVRLAFSITYQLNKNLHNDNNLKAMEALVEANQYFLRRNMFRAAKAKTIDTVVDVTQLSAFHRKIPTFGGDG